MTARIFFIAIAILFMVVIVTKVKKKRFFERESVLWIVGSLLVLFLALFPGIVEWIAKFAGIKYSPSLLFLCAILFLLLLEFRQGQHVSLLKEEVKDLGQRIVVLEKLLDEKESDKNKE